MRRLVAFDLDGVIYSTEPFLGEAYREAIAAVEAVHPGSFSRVPSTREILDHVGWPVEVILDRLFPNVAPATRAALNSESLRTICAHVAKKDGQLFAGVHETLQALAAEDFVLTIASNGRRAYVQSVLDAYDLQPFFAELITIQEGEVNDKTAILRAYLARHAVPVTQAAMVGDRASDVEAARNTGTAFIGCDYGHGHRAEIEAAGPTVGRFADLLPLLRSVLPQNVVSLPQEPNVFECRLCHKVFESRRRNPPCPECDSNDAELVSD